MYDNPTILNLHLRLWDSYMSKRMSGQSNFALCERWKAES